MKLVPKNDAAKKDSQASVANITTLRSSDHIATLIDDEGLITVT
jgi:hypothetical protein